jgi:hypothetical protein
MTKINISIPKPCHEDWHAMTPGNKGRFCGSCQKNVFDFTSSSDREIINAFQQNENLCGRFLNTQLNRDLVKPKEKSSIWMATASALISFIGLGTHQAQAQGEVKVEQTDRKIRYNKADKDTILVAGIVYDENKVPRPHLGIYGGLYKIGETDANGNFSIYTRLGARLVFRNEDEDEEDAADYYVKNNCSSNIEVNTEQIRLVRKSHTVGGITTTSIKIKKLTFFGRIFRRIGNLFR